jgi:hypothetical protein
MLYHFAQIVCQIGNKYRIRMCFFLNRKFEDALGDVQEALRIAPPHNREVRRVLGKVRDEVRAEMTSPHLASHKGLATSVDMLSEPETRI